MIGKKVSVSCTSPTICASVMWFGCLGGRYCAFWRVSSTGLLPIRFQSKAIGRQSQSLHQQCRSGLDERRERNSAGPIGGILQGTAARISALFIKPNSTVCWHDHEDDVQRRRHVNRAPLCLNRLWKCGFFIVFEQCLKRRLQMIILCHSILAKTEMRSVHRACGSLIFSAKELNLLPLFILMAGISIP